MPLEKSDVFEALKKVQDPELHKNLVELGMIKDVEINGDAVRVTVALTFAGCPLKSKIRQDVEEALRSIQGVGHVEVVMTSMTSEERARLFGQAPTEMEGIKEVKKIVAIASGKGGVGKSTVSVNLAVALAKIGARTGILDADFHGPDIPVMLGIEERPIGSKGMLLPLEKYGIKVMSTATLAGEGVPIVWRGPLVNKAIKEFLGKVKWGKLDFLVIDLPPGTGDAVITITKSIPLDGVIVVTTPQKVAISDVRRAMGLFKGQGIPIWGIVENMSYLKLPGDDKGKMDIFGSGGGEKLAKAFKVDLLAQIPLDPQIRIGGDNGKPVAIERNEVSEPFYEMAEKIKEKFI